MQQDFLKGTLSTLILSLLKEKGKMYGYEICQETKLRSLEVINVTEGSIYPALHKMEKKGLILSSKEKFNGRVRKYYAINEQKSAQVVDQILSLKDFIQGLNLVLKAN